MPKCVEVVTLAEIKLDMTDNKYNSSALMLRDRMPELNYRYCIFVVQHLCTYGYVSVQELCTSVLVQLFLYFCYCSANL